MQEHQVKPRKEIVFPIVIVAGLPLLGAFLLILYFIWALESSTIPEPLLAQIHQGMSKQDLQDLVGPPTEITQSTPEKEVWIYKKTFQWRFVKITLKNDAVFRVIQE